MKLAFADAAAARGRPGLHAPSAGSAARPRLSRRRAALIDRRARGDPRHGAPRPGGTVYLTAADADGMMVSLIQSNYMGFGSGVVVPGTGIALQNRGAGFALERRPRQRRSARASGRSTRSSPASRRTDGEPLMAFGVMGGPMQAAGPRADGRCASSTTARTRRPRRTRRAGACCGGRQVAVEPAFPAKTRAALAALGHELDPSSPWSAISPSAARRRSCAWRAATSRARTRARTARRSASERPSNNVFSTLRPSSTCGSSQPRATFVLSNSRVQACAAPTRHARSAAREMVMGLRHYGVLRGRSWRPGAKTTWTARTTRCTWPRPGRTTRLGVNVMSQLSPSELPSS